MNSAFVTGISLVAVTNLIAFFVVGVRTWGRVGNLEVAFLAFQQSANKQFEDLHKELAESRRETSELRALVIEVLRGQAEAKGESTMVGRIAQLISASSQEKSGQSSAS